VKKTINKIKRLPTEQEKIFENDMTNKWLICKIYKESIQFNIKKNKLDLKMGKKSEYNFFSQKDIQMVNRYTRRCSILLRIREMKITRNPYILWECKLVVPLWNTVRRSLRNLKIELLYNVVISLSGYLS